MPSICQSNDARSFPLFTVSNASVAPRGSREGCRTWRARRSWRNTTPQRTKGITTSCDVTACRQCEGLRTMPRMLSSTRRDKAPEEASPTRLRRGTGGKSTFRLRFSRLLWRCCRRCPFAPSWEPDTATSRQPHRSSRASSDR